MRKVKAVCIYRDTQIFNLTALLDDTKVTLVQHDLNTSPDSHPTFQHLIYEVLDLLRANNMRCGYYREFNSIWYDIAFIDLNNPTVIAKYSVPEKECEGV